ncbi:hypothetical protein GNI_040650 [Gregarina niphandrodes]|uniref:Uncharacterized protein n=1 Tax=Gregarina niphandrodes TaxID=110365 RepID=A0A023BA88_GRENI|nr:hypothetical protein GNI_040650 [Gregarina niphandrodes]EZG78163.1 hypothetical protein GNI_040650 [Gregarina niphandrodes]|eukprot:XP_011129449.1 hypothetical protein GNI_040650 [Gregarina niphandrodes]
MKSIYAAEGVSPGLLTLVLASGLGEGSIQIVDHHPGGIREGLTVDTEVVDIEISNNGKESIETEKTIGVSDLQLLEAPEQPTGRPNACDSRLAECRSGTVLNESLDQIEIMTPNQPYPIVVGDVVSASNAAYETSIPEGMLGTVGMIGKVGMMGPTGTRNTCVSTSTRTPSGPPRGTGTSSGPPGGTGTPSVVTIGPEPFASRTAGFRFNSRDCLTGFVGNREFRILGRIVEGVQSLVRSLPDVREVHVPCVIVLNRTDRSIINLAYDVSNGTFKSTDHNEVVTFSSVTNEDVEQTIISLQDFNCGFLDVAGSLLYRQPVAALL